MLALVSLMLIKILLSLTSCLAGASGNTGEVEIRSDLRDEPRSLMWEKH